VQENIIQALNTGFLIAGTETVKVEGSRYTDGSPTLQRNRAFAIILEDLFEGLDVG
jgi:hypothetical protein